VRCGNRTTSAAGRARWRCDRRAISPSSLRTSFMLPISVRSDGGNSTDPVRSCRGNSIDLDRAAVTSLEIERCFHVAKRPNGRQSNCFCGAPDGARRPDEMARETFATKLDRAIPASREGPYPRTPACGDEPRFPCRDALGPKVGSAYRPSVLPSTSSVRLTTNSEVN
jgi:hypothetical protein